MNFKSVSYWLGKIVIVSEIFLLLYLLWWRLRLGLTRYFDVDEFAHLHWGHNLFIGQRPYTDFYYIFPPFFLYILAGVWFVFREAVSVVIEARIVIFILFVLTSLLIFLITKTKHTAAIALLAAITFAFLPIPYDKLLEVRPDLPATFFSLLGMYGAIRAIGMTKEKSRKKAFWWFFFSGICYGVGVAFVPKTVFFLPPVVLMFVFLWLVKKEDIKEIGRMWGFWVLGLLIPLIIVGLAAIFYGNPVLAFLLMTKIPSDASKLLSSIYNHSFYMAPSLFFHHNQTYYGAGGYPLGWIVNLVIWLISSIWGVVRLVGFINEEKKEDQAINLIIAATFFTNFWAFVNFFPLKHAQYLISLVPFVVYYWADMWGSIQKECERRNLGIIFQAGFVVLLVIIMVASESTNRPKLAWDNSQNLRDTEKMVRGIPANSYVFDLSGQSLIFRDPYYICCVPYGQYLPTLPPLSPLRDSLTLTKTKYVVAGRLDTLPGEDQKYIGDNYTLKILDGLVLKLRE